MKEHNLRDRFDITPQQYHAGLDKLWVALGINTVQTDDVFTLAAVSIAQRQEQRDALLAACKFAKAQIQKGAQQKALPVLRAAIAKAEEGTT